ncbi:Lrp/AsnC family transcriptional regulator [Microbacterium sp. NPDC056569]|uniref:Lrp/AsnC family transcriptional regulator n=1 Tax=Microbacterium sp. NPDC056569 TaxID=3345867 RepID=UPI00366A834E
MQETSLGDLDLQIIHALQIEPRVAWTALAPILGIDAVTLARRWERISSEGTAWLSAVRGAGEMPAAALVEFSCEPGSVLDVADAAALIPEIYSIDVTAGGRDLIATVVSRTDGDLAELLLGRLGRIHGVRTVRTDIVTDVVRLGSDWTVRALTPAQQDRIPAARPPRPGAAKSVPADLADAIRRALEPHARAPFRDIGERVGVSAQRAADAVALLRRTGRLVLRADGAAPFSNWPIAAWYFLQVPSAELASARRALASLPAVQYAAIATGASNMIVAAGARRKSEVVRFEMELAQRIPGIHVQDRSMVLRVHKHLGRLLEPSGRASGAVVPLP